MTTPVHSPTKGAWLARRARPLLAAYVLVLALALLSPTSGLQDALVRDLVGSVDDAVRLPGLSVHSAEIGLNVAILAPVAFLGRLALPATTWTGWTAYVFVASGVVELVQELALPGRQASTTDVVANTLGALVGGVLAALLLRALGTARSPGGRRRSGV